MNVKVVRIVGILLALVGLVLLLSNVSLTQSAGAAIMQRNGGSMSTDIYLAEMQAAGAAYRWLGAVLLAVGLLRATLPPSK